jgi:two-component system, chemotaxis family, protein-glutamate methylesterase/glutaminase
MAPIRVLPVDDSVVMRRAIAEMLAGEPDIVVQRPAPSGAVALQRIHESVPDVVVLDVEMPDMTGLQVLAAIRRVHPRLPVIMFSALTNAGSATTVEALALGASDYLAKPSLLGASATGADTTRADLVTKVRALVRGAGVGADGGRTRVVPTTRRRQRPGTSRVELLVIGCSTGGPSALSAVVPELPASFPAPVLIVQHMPPMFTGLLAERLDRESHLDVREGIAGAALEPGVVWLAPGGKHMVVERGADGLVLALGEGPLENSCRPAVDPLFRSVAALAGDRTLAVVMTGMGQDGLRGCEAIVAAGGHVIAQDEATSVVWGMPGAVVGHGLADAVLPLDGIAAEILRRAPATLARQSLGDGVELP